MDYNNLQADRNCILNDARGYSHMAGRDGHNIEHIVLHHNAGVRQSGETVARFWERSGTSAHYQVEDDGTVVQIVHHRHRTRQHFRCSGLGDFGRDDSFWRQADWSSLLRIQSWLPCLGPECLPAFELHGNLLPGTDPRRIP